jgi:hypothetical protein
MLKYEVWGQEQAEKEIRSRLKKALIYQEKFHSSWAEKENILFKSLSDIDRSVGYNVNDISRLFGGEMNEADSRLSVNYAYKYVRFIHSQMVANPPVVMPRPVSYDFSDQRAARAADHIAHHLRREYGIQGMTADVCLLVLTHGTGFCKTENNPYLGDVLEVDRQTQTLVLSGDFDFKAVSVWDLLLDPSAARWKDMRFVFHRHVMSKEEAEMKFPKHKDKLRNYEKKAKPDRFWEVDSSGTESEIVEIWEYIEKGLPQNGLVGRQMFLLPDGQAVSDIQESPYPEARLPFHILTDVDVPGAVYGKTFVDYIVRLQAVLNQLDSVYLENVQNHGVIRMVVYDAAESEEGNITGNSVDVINVRGTAAQKPDFINPPGLMGDFHRLREQLVSAMEQLAGVNESMFGQQSREMSGFSMQTAINAGNMIRTALFNKYKLFVENVYDYAFLLVDKHWTTKRKIHVVGKENSYDIKYYSRDDVKRGFVLDLEYGETFSIDPAARREEIIQSLPLLKEAGVPVATVLSMLRFNNISGIFDRIDAAKQRQLEIFDEMKLAFYETKTIVNIPPEQMQEHKGMLDAAYDYINTKEFDLLDSRLKAAIKDHIKAREELAASEAATGAQGTPAPAASSGPPDLSAILGGAGGLPPQP